MVKMFFFKLHGMKSLSRLYWCNILFVKSCVMPSNRLYDIKIPAQKWGQLIKVFVSSDWSYLFFFNDRLFPFLLKRELNIITWTNTSDSSENPFSERSIPSKIKLTSVRTSIGTDSVWLALSSLKLASVDWHYELSTNKCIINWRLLTLQRINTFGIQIRPVLKKSFFFS